MGHRAKFRQPGPRALGLPRQGRYSNFLHLPSNKVVVCTLEEEPKSFYIFSHLIPYNCQVGWCYSPQFIDENPVGDL